MDTEEKLNRAIYWSENQKWAKKFDSSFLHSVKDNYYKYGEFTTDQERAINNIYNKFKIDEWFKKISKKTKIIYTGDKTWMGNPAMDNSTRYYSKTCG